MKYDVIQTGSKGNAVVFNDFLMVDCGVSYKKLTPYINTLKLVCLTHRHGDHFNIPTITRLSRERPTLWWYAPEWLYGQLVLQGVNRKYINIVRENLRFEVGDEFTIEAFDTHHDVPNVGYKIHLKNGNNWESIVYATDTNELPDIPNYDFYFLEANYKDLNELAERSRKKLESGGYRYENRVADTHMSEEYALGYIARNMKTSSQYVLLHQHEEE